MSRVASKIALSASRAEENMVVLSLIEKGNGSCSKRNGRTGTGRNVSQAFF